MHLVQIINDANQRRVGTVEDDRLILIDEHSSIYALAQAALASASTLSSTARRYLSSSAALDYNEIYKGQTDWRILPSIDHPEEPTRCLVSGTGLTHKGSADNRQAMHTAVANPEAVITDSMRMFQWGLEGGRPGAGAIGAEPEWFYKGDGTTLLGHGEALVVPPYAGDGGEEPEIAGVYLIDEAGTPRRLGMVIGNEFSDHQLEKRNYLYLASSKLRNCAIGPELVLEPQFDAVAGEVSIERGGQVLWAREITTGEEMMSHSLENLEHHHFKHRAHRRPGDLHIHFFGAAAFSFGAGLALSDGDVMQVSFAGFGRPLRN
ncbi:MAG: GguC protein, partial [Pyrinomonadaceae bacterium]|nr:GguC protein [Pyrinomonadaceae bacterium]